MIFLFNFQFHEFFSVEFPISRFFSFGRYKMKAGRHDVLYQAADADGNKARCVFTGM